MDKIESEFLLPLVVQSWAVCCFAEVMRENRRLMERGMREIEREKQSLHTIETKLIQEIKKAAKVNQWVTFTLLLLLCSPGRTVLFSRELILVQIATTAFMSELTYAVHCNAIRALTHTHTHTVVCLLHDATDF